jgi:hypothetical protein
MIFFLTSNQFRGNIVIIIGEISELFKNKRKISHRLSQTKIFKKIIRGKGGKGEKEKL